MGVEECHYAADSVPMKRTCSRKTSNNYEYCGETSPDRRAGEYEYSTWEPQIMTFSRAEN